MSQQRLGAEVGADESKVFEFSVASAVKVHDVATVELQLSNLRPLSINFDSIAEDANFDTVLFGLTSAVLILDNTNFCHFAFSSSLVKQVKVRLPLSYLNINRVSQAESTQKLGTSSKRLYEHILAKVPTTIYPKISVGCYPPRFKHCQQTKQCLMTVS